MKTLIITIVAIFFITVFVTAWKQTHRPPFDLPEPMFAPLTVEKPITIPDRVWTPADGQEK